MPGSVLSVGGLWNEKQLMTIFKGIISNKLYTDEIKDRLSIFFQVSNKSDTNLKQ